MICSSYFLEKQNSPSVRKAILLIGADLSADLSLHSLVETLTLSPAYFSDLFRRETGQTLSHYINEQRMLLAAELLDSTALQIQTVAQHCGVLDVQYFSKLFKKHIGMTPKEYRKRSR